MKKTIYQRLYHILSYLSNRFNNRYLTKYKVLLGTSLLVLMNLSTGCKRNARVSCYEVPPMPEDTIEVTAQQDSLEVVCYAAVVDPVDIPEISLPEVLPEKLVSADPEVIGETGTTEAPVMDVDDEVMCYDIHVFDIPEVSPKFPGGERALMSYISDSLRYPAEAKGKRIEGRVVVMFTVMKDGSVDSATIVFSPDMILNEEALRVIREMPKWEPALQRNKPVEVKYTLPVRFRLPK